MFDANSGVKTVRIPIMIVQIVTIMIVRLLLVSAYMSVLRVSLQCNET